MTDDIGRTWGREPDAEDDAIAKIAGDVARGGQRVAGYCPMGCGQTLMLGEGGHVTCSHLECSNPTAVDDILDDSEIHHIVELGETTFSVQHPLRERVDGQLFTCKVHDHLSELDPPRKPGRYRVIPMAEGGYAWTRADNPGVLTSG